MKTCKKCSEVKPLSEFGRRAALKDGLQSMCKKCQHDYQNRRYQQGERQWDWHVQKKYGIPAVEYAQMILDQDGKCAICGVEVSVERGQRGDPTRACLDHDHVTGQNRQILCQTCNQGLGQFKDNAELLLAAAAYIKKHNPLSNPSCGGNTSQLGV